MIPRTPRPGAKGKRFVEPTIFTNVSNRMRIAQEEVFDPVLAVISFEDEADELGIANDIVYGFAADLDLIKIQKISKCEMRTAGA